MADCPFCVSRRTFVTRTLGAGLALGLVSKLTSKALAQGSPNQGPEVTSEELAVAHIDYSAFVDGPADFHTVKITFPAGALITWHRHPGPVFAEVISGTLTNHYDTLGCEKLWPAGTAVYIPRDLIHDDANESNEELVVMSTFIVPAASPLRIPVETPQGSKCETVEQSAKPAW